jgi:hypothetical protein
MIKSASQDAQAPFCLMPIRFVPEPVVPSPLVMALAPVGAAILAFGLWDMTYAPEYSVSVVIMLFGAALLWGGGAHILRVLRRPTVPVGYWLGFESRNLILADYDRMYSWPWARIGEFRVTQTVRNEFVTRYKSKGLDEEVSFEQHVAITLAADLSDGPAIEIPFERFINCDEGRRAAADRLCLFLNDVRHRALNGGLERDAPPFLVPIDLTIVPMRAGSPAEPEREAAVPQSAVQRR